MLMLCYELHTLMLIPFSIELYKISRKISFYFQSQFENETNEHILIKKYIWVDIGEKSTIPTIS